MDQHFVLVVSDNVSLSDLKELTHLIEGNLNDTSTENKSHENEGNKSLLTTPGTDCVKAVDKCTSGLSTDKHLLRPPRKPACPSRQDYQIFEDDIKRGMDEDDDHDYVPTKKSNNSKHGKKSKGRNKNKKLDENTSANNESVKDGGTNDNSGIYLCQICSKRFRQKGNLKAHLRVHTDDKPFSCLICRKGFKSKEALLRHQFIHTGEKPYNCNLCAQGFSSSLALKEHKARHNNQILYKCQICNRGFRHTSALKRHSTIHSDLTPFSCDVCDRKFTQKSYLRSHQRSHTGERPFSCDKCGKRFAHLSDVTRHKIIHTGKKPFVCKHCGSSFSDPSSHRRHERDHITGKTFRCESCNQQFKRSVQLKNHMTKAHNIDLREPDEVICVEQVNDNDVSVMFIREDSKETSEKCDQLSLKDANLEADECAVNGIVNQSDLLIDKSANIDKSVPPETPKEENLNKFSEKMDFVKNPDFSCQEYYDWLSNFTSHVSSVVAPIDMQTFFDITHVHKTLANVLAQPTKVLINKKNFQIMLDIMNNLQISITAQLSHVLNTLSEEE